jgi:acyl-CoA dehydrogenase
MENRVDVEAQMEDADAVAAGGCDAMGPLAFSTNHSRATSVYLADPSTRKLVEFFQRKGLQVLKEEDQREQWYEDWIEYQALHGLYASLLSPKKYSSQGRELDLLRLTRFLEVFAYLSPAHGYSLQVTFLGLFSILMGSNEALKQEAVAALEKGALFALGVSEQRHGSDLLANEFEVATVGSGQMIANGSKYHIGNANCASTVSVLARKVDERFPDRARRAVPVLFALRPGQSPGFGDVRKIRTLGIRSAFVGEFKVKDHPLPETDVIAQGRQAWDAVLGTVTLGKFFLGFGTIGICEHGLEEALAHLNSRVLYGKPVVDMPHIGSAVSQAYARLLAMKLYAYRALDYVRIATPNDRRYLLFCAVQKAKVSTEGVKVISQLSECIGAKGFEADTYFEMALRDVQLIPGLEGSMHINLGLAGQFIPAYFNNADPKLPFPESSSAHPAPAENAYLMEARGGQINTIQFRPYLEGYRPLKSVANVRIFARQAMAFRRFVRGRTFHPRDGDTAVAMEVGRCMATIAYGQLIGESAAYCDLPPAIISTLFHNLVSDLTTSALVLASSRRLKKLERILIERMIRIPKTLNSDWECALQRATVVR